MRIPVAEAVNWGNIRDTVAGSIIAGVGLSLAFGLLLLGGIRARESYSQGRRAQATAYGALAGVALAATGAGIVLGLIVMAQK
jgi:hypothetical protein